MRYAFRLLFGAPAVLLAACSSGGTDPAPPAEANCENPATVTLAVGGHGVVDPRDSDGCIRLPAAPGGASYLVSAVSGAGTETSTGTSGSYYLQVSTTAQGVVASLAPVPSTTREEVPLPVRFHQMLRERERELAARPDLRIQPSEVQLAQAPPPEVGSERDFSVCANTSCSAFDTVTAVARAVGTKVAVYLDKDAPVVNGLTQEDLDGLAATFNNHHYAIAAEAFGTESDLDNDGVVILLITPAVNQLTTNCTGGRIIGFFWPGDLLNIPGSNRAEVLYGLSTAAATGSCTAVDRERALRLLKPVMIHELQHLVNFNQKVLVRGATSSEEVWLNEALSHYAEELAGRLIPNSDCPGATSCLLFYNTGNLLNLYDYLESTEGSFLVMPRNSTGTLAERGAAWAFLRWLTDHHGSDSLGMDLTAQLVQTTRFGSNNVSIATGQPFPGLIGEYFSALYLDNLAGFTPLSPRLSFRWWNFRAIFQANCCEPDAAFPQAFPFSPPVAAGPFSLSGTLRDGSGRHIQVNLPAGSPGFDILLARQAGGLVTDASLAARLAIVRLN